MSENDFFKEVRENKDYEKAIELVPYAQFLGVRFEETDEGLLFTLPFDQDIIGNTHLPALHGGAIAGFMENAAIMHLMWNMNSMSLPKNIDFTIDYILSGRPQDVYARCQVVKLGRRVANVQIEAWQDSPDKPITIARSHFKLF